MVGGGPRAAAPLRRACLIRRTNENRPFHFEAAPAPDRADIHSGPVRLGPAMRDAAGPSRAPRLRGEGWARRGCPRHAARQQPAVCSLDVESPSGRRPAHPSRARFVCARARPLHPPILHRLTTLCLFGPEEVLTAPGSPLRSHGQPESVSESARPETVPDSGRSVGGATRPDAGFQVLSSEDVSDRTVSSQLPLSMSACFIASTITMKR